MLEYCFAQKKKRTIINVTLHGKKSTGMSINIFRWGGSVHVGFFTNNHNEKEWKRVCVRKDLSIETMFRITDL